ncbi:MAG: hypothetical protein DCF19_07875 [Pseudanabaena frigida]|uniref:ATP-dependent DNA helicase n=1 Tax=Pseudanabaena frigida TaxID=945775 RepID=A0A2W4WCE3_9CYAN|nr:MAG: hypothetical protein DCF19_07875 [Pseudanabaena frigida]
MKFRVLGILFITLVSSIAFRPTMASAAELDIRVTNQQNPTYIKDRDREIIRQREQQQRLAEQRAHEQQQRLAEQRAHEQQQRLAQQREREQQQRLAQQREREQKLRLAQLREREYRQQQDRYAQNHH